MFSISGSKSIELVEKQVAHTEKQYEDSFYSPISVDLAYSKLSSLNKYQKGPFLEKRAQAYGDVHKELQTCKSMLNEKVRSYEKSGKLESKKVEIEALEERIETLSRKDKEIGTGWYSVIRRGCVNFAKEGPKVEDTEVLTDVSSKKADIDLIFQDIVGFRVSELEVEVVKASKVKGEGKGNGIFGVVLAQGSSDDESDTDTVGLDASRETNMEESNSDNEIAVQKE